MDRLLKAINIVANPVCEAINAVKQGDYFVDRGGTLYIAYRHFDTKVWVVINLETGVEHGGNTKVDSPQLSDITYLSITLTKVNV